MTEAATLRALQQEICECFNTFSKMAEGLTDTKQLLTVYLEQNAAMTEILRKQRRHLKYMNGEKIEPETHTVEAVLVGFGGCEMP